MEVGGEGYYIPIAQDERGEKRRKIAVIENILLA